MCCVLFCVVGLCCCSVSPSCFHSPTSQMCTPGSNHQITTPVPDLLVTCLKLYNYSRNHIYLSYPQIQYTSHPYCITLTVILLPSSIYPCTSCTLLFLALCVVLQFTAPVYSYASVYILYKTS